MIDAVGSAMDSEETKMYIYHFLKKEKTQMPRQYQEVFDHHINVMIYRLQHDEKIDVDDSGIESQVSKRSLELAERMLEPLFKKYSIKRKELEIMLIAIYLDLAKEEK